MLRKTFILFALLLLAFTFGWLSTSGARALPLAQESTPTAEHEEGEEHEHGERIEAGDASIRITSPVDGAVVTENSVRVDVETTNFELGEDRHFHLYVDGHEQGMSQGTSKSLMAVDLQPGDNVLEVVLSNEEHQELDASHTITIQYDAAAQPSGVPGSIPPGAEDNTAMIIGIVVAVLVVGGIGFAIARRR